MEGNVVRKWRCQGCGSSVGRLPGSPKCGSCATIAAEAQPAHGEQRNRRMERTFGSLSVKEETVYEAWCAACSAWVECRGVLGPLEFQVHHRLAS